MSQVQINGVMYDVPEGSTVSVINGQVTITETEAGSARKAGECRTPLEVKVVGDAINVNVDYGNVTVHGDVTGFINAKGNVTCVKVGAHINAGGNVNCKDVGGSVEAKGNVICAIVHGPINAGGNVFGKG